MELPAEMPGKTAKPNWENEYGSAENPRRKSGIDHEGKIQIGKSRAICYNRWKSVDRANEITYKTVLVKPNTKSGKTKNEGNVTILWSRPPKWWLLISNVTFPKKEKGFIFD